MVRAFGISVNRWEPENVLRALDTGLIDSVQVVYNIFDQAPEDILFPYCQRRGIGVIARVPFDEGSLTGTLTCDLLMARGRLAQHLLQPRRTSPRRCRGSSDWVPSCRPAWTCRSWPSDSSWSIPP